MNKSKPIVKSNPTTSTECAAATQRNEIQMPPEFYELTPEQIVFLCGCELTRTGGRTREIPTLEQWDSLNDERQRLFRCEAFWAIKGADDPGWTAFLQGLVENPHWTDSEWCRQRGLPVWEPKTYKELEAKFLPPPAPNIHLIMARCPQMAMLLALGGDVLEPYWWAGLSITEHAEPNLSRECSDKYPNFSEEELEYRQSRIKNEGTKPALCSRLDDVNTGVCPSCRFHGVIGSPIALGYKHEPKGGHHV